MDNALIVQDGTSVLRTKQEQLAYYEKAIEDGIEQIYRGRIMVGYALIQINEGSLWEGQYESFEDYCERRWNVSTMASAYHLMSAAEVVGDLEGEFDPEELPQLPSHAARLHILDETQRAKAWREVLSTYGEDVRGQDVETVAQKHVVIGEGGALAYAVKHQLVAPREAYKVKKFIGRFPPGPFRDKYMGAIERSISQHGTCVRQETLDALRSLEYRYPDEVDSILATGTIYGWFDEIPLHEATARDIENYGRQLDHERTNTQKIVVGEKQREKASSDNLIIADGFEIPEKVEKAGKEGGAMLYLFLGRAFTLKELASLLEKNNVEALYVAAYTTGEEPKFNFDGRGVFPSSIDGVKPQRLLQAFKESVIA